MSKWIMQGVNKNGYKIGSQFGKEHCDDCTSLITLDMRLGSKS